MNKELKLEVGKTYETKGNPDGSGRSRVLISKIQNGVWYGIIIGTAYVRKWGPDGSILGYPMPWLNITRCLDDEPELVDLTKIDVPFGELDERTQWLLRGAHAAGMGVELLVDNYSDWRTILTTTWDSQEIYRLKPEERAYTLPTVDDKVWLGLPGAKAVAWGDRDPHGYAYTGIPTRDSSSWRGEACYLNPSFVGDLIQRGDCPWDQAIVLRPEGL